MAKNFFNKKKLSPKTVDFLKETGQKVADGGKKLGELGGEALKAGFDKGKEKLEEGKDYIERQKKLTYSSIESLKPIVNVVNESAAALQDKNRVISNSSIPDVLAGSLGAGLGGALSFAALYGLGTTGLSAVGISTGLAAVGGTMVGGIFVLAAPIAIGAGVGVSLAYKKRQDQLAVEKERLYKEALLKHEGIIRAMEDEADANKERMDYLESLNILLRQAIKELKEDLAITNGEI